MVLKLSLEEKIKQLGALNTGVAQVKDMVFDKGFRRACESNACGRYNRCWTCPPCVGEIDDLINLVKGYKTAIVYQTIGELEDSYDFEGMMEIGDVHKQLDIKVSEYLEEKYSKDSFLLLGAGGCRICEKCAKIDNTPCRFPDKAMHSLEAYGVSVSVLASLSGLKYINGENTATYFGAVFQK